MYRFQNGRKRAHQTLPEVLARKRPKRSNANVTRHMSTTPKWGLANYLPEREAGEDDTSVKQHTEWLKIEKMKKKPNYEKACLLMDKTLSDRRKLIVENNPSLEIIKTEYPWHFQEEEVCYKIFML